MSAVIWPASATPDGRARRWVQRAVETDPDPTHWTHEPVDDEPEPDERQPDWQRCPCCPNGFAVHRREDADDGEH